MFLSRRLLASVIALVPLSLNALTINLNYTASGNPNDALAQAGFIEAAEYWESVLADNVQVNLDVAYQTLGSGILGSASSSSVLHSYQNVRTNLLADVSSADDASSSGSLQTGPALDLYINRTFDNPNGSGSATAYLDNDGGANNVTIDLNTANARALGLLSANDPLTDGAITFNNQFNFDFDRSDGIGSGQFDFIGVAIHEIGHTLGFVSGVDILDGNSPPHNGPFNDDLFTFVTTLDLFRFSDLTAGQLGVIDWTASNTEKHFSVDGGLTYLDQFSRGVNFGDGRQASHWLDNQNIGAMDPTIGPGEFVDVTTRDLQAFDVIGWDLTVNVEVTAPSSIVLLSLVLIGLGARHRRGIG